MHVIYCVSRRERQRSCQRARALAARTAVIERIKLKLYEPFARMLGVSKEYFEDTFPKEMAAKTAGIPDEHMITPPASVAVPAMQGLSYTFDEPDLKDLYLNLLTTATDDRRTDDAHPAFADVIKQLTPSEARLLNEILGQAAVTIARVKNMVESGGFHLRITHLLPLGSAETGEPTEIPQVAAWVDNWARLGLVEVTYEHHRVGDSAYDWVPTRPEYIRISLEPGINRLEFDKGLLRRTAFG